MKYCSECSHPVVYTIPEGEDRERFFCRRCDTIHYQNPKMVVGAIAERANKIILCRRAIEPRQGYWTIPAGYMENGETVQECAKRESMEEALVELDELTPYALLNISFINQVYLIFRGRLVNDDFRPGPESIEVQLVDLANIPWDDLAFRVIHQVLSVYREDMAGKRYPFRIMDVPPPEQHRK